MTRKHSISLCSATGVRNASLLLVALLLASSTQAVANSEDSSMWQDARIGVNGGTIGALAIPLSNETTYTEVSMNVSDMCPVVEVYTATWCENCVITENALDEAIGDSDVIRIHYHRHRSEPEDPFGNNATEHRWESTYGGASTAETGMSRVAPSTVFDGERLHLGTSPSSSSLVSDYSTSLNAGHTSFTGSARLSVTSYDSETRIMQFSWNVSQPSGPGSGDPPMILTAWLLFVEDSASFPDGSNGIGDYLHVLHDAIELNDLEGTGLAQVPAAWDGDDVSVLLLIDWSSPTIDCCGPDWPLPAPGIFTVLICFLAALLPSRRKRLST